MRDPIVPRPINPMSITHLPSPKCSPAAGRHCGSRRQAEKECRAVADPTLDPDPTSMCFNYPRAIDRQADAAFVGVAALPEFLEEPVEVFPRDSRPESR